MKPIIFSTPMVKAILEGRKTMTRRVIKPKYKKGEAGFEVGKNDMTGERSIWTVDEEGGTAREFVPPPYQPGDILWVRETWMPFGKVICYRADGEIWEKPHFYKTDKWKPSIFMPRKATRIFLEVVSVRVERLKDITESDAKAEGVDREHRMMMYAGIGLGGEKAEKAIERVYRDEFKLLWDSLNAKRGYSWKLNPWVWVIEFKRAKEP